MIDRLIHIIADELEIAPETLDETSDMATVEAWDSLGHLNVVLAVEESFGVRFPPQDIPRLTSVAALAAGVREAGTS